MFILKEAWLRGGVGWGGGPTGFLGICVAFGVLEVWGGHSHHT